VPRPPTLDLSERQAPEHSKSPMFYKYQFEFFMFDALRYGVVWKPLDEYDLLVQKYIYLESCVGLGSNICLAMLSSVEVG